MAMADQEPSPKSPVEIIEAEIKHYLNGAEPGSPQLLAFGDVYREDRLRRSWQDQTKDLSKSTPQDRLKNESSLRITELEMAIIKHQAANREIEIKGYGQHHTYLEEKWYSLKHACQDDVRSYTPNVADVDPESESLFEEITFNIKSSMVG